MAMHNWPLPDNPYELDRQRRTIEEDFQRHTYAEHRREFERLIGQIAPSPGLTPVEKEPNKLLLLL